MPEPTPTYRILILINVRWWNATAFYAVNLARILAKNGHRVFVGCRKGYPAFEKARALGLTVVPLDFTGYNPFTLGNNLCALVRFIRKNRIQVVNAHRSEDHTFAVLAGRLTAAGVVLTRGDRRPIKPNRLSSLKYRLCDGIIATCRRIVDNNPHAFAGLETKTAVIYGSVDEDRFKPTRASAQTRRRYGIQNDSTVVGLVGRLSPVKDPVTFIQAAARVAGRHKRAAFLVAGKNVELKAADLKALARREGLAERIRFLPHVDDIADLMHACDLGVITSTGSETISRVLLEFMYLGKPVVGTRINAIAEIIRPGVTGDLAEPGDAVDLAEKIGRLLDTPRLMAAYAQNARRFYGSRYAESCFLQQTLRVFDQAIERKRQIVKSGIEK